MTPEADTFDALQRGDVVLAPDPFDGDPDSARPWAVVNNHQHPFDGDQYVTMALTTRTWYDDRVPLGESDFERGQTPDSSALVPHAIASVQPRVLTEYVCRLRSAPVDEAVDRLTMYLGPEN